MSIQHATWIGDTEQCISPVIQKTLTIDRPRSGSIHITGLGFFILTVNGCPVTEDRHTPALTDYEPRDMRRWKLPLYDTTTHRIGYLEYDLTPYLRSGDNLLEVHLGPGWYRQEERMAEGPTTFGRQLKTVFWGRIETEAGASVEFCSDGSECWRPSHIVYSNLYIGEIHDLTAKEEAPRPVQVLPAPAAALVRQVCPPDRVIRRLTPTLLSERDGVRIYDAGENISGHLCVRAAGSPGDKISLRFAEELAPDGGLDFFSTGGYIPMASGRVQIQTDEFVCGGEPHLFYPQFTWHAFRYVELSGALSAIEEMYVEVVHTDVAVTSAFASDSPGLDKLYRAYIRTQLDNLHGCIPSDCPHRERLGYTGDGQAVCHAAMLTLDMREAYCKWIRDILDCQDTLNGHVQHTAPVMGGGGGPGGWGCAMVILPDEFDRHYDDIDLLRECYPAMKRWVGYLKSHTELGLVTTEEKDGWCLGDWAYPEGERAPEGDTPALPEPFFNTCYLLDSLRRMERVARRVGAEEDLPAYAQLADSAKRALLQNYFDPATGSFVGGSRGADALAIWAGLDGDERTLQNLVARYSAMGCFDTGFLATEHLISVLIDRGYADLAYALLTATGDNTYGPMLEREGGTLWEYMDGRYSHSHPMFGAPVAHLFDGFLGIRQEAGSLGYERLLIAPRIPAALGRAEGRVTLPCGEVAVAFVQTENDITLTLSLPEGGARVVVWGEERVLGCGEHCVIVKRCL